MMCRTGNLLALLVRMQIGAPTMAISVAAANDLPTNPAVPLLGIYPK